MRWRELKAVKEAESFPFVNTSVLCSCREFEEGQQKALKQGSERETVNVFTKLPQNDYLRIKKNAGWTKCEFHT